MIDTALDFISKRLNAFLRVKYQDQSNSIDYIQLNNIAWNDQSISQPTTNNAFITLVNIEEDRVSKSPDNYVRTNTGIVYQNPTIFLNLYVLFAANLNSYEESLTRLSYIIQFFQFQNVFTTLDSPGLPQGIDKLIFDLKTLSFQDLNNLWGILGSKYLPSVVYILRLVTITSDFEMGNVPLLHEIVVNDKTLQQ
ncbi:Protein of unknown function [Mucilaginibacter mallensis]|uniref:Pvc16 N-terminal domain-containing protein n=1 Tax=Mucilaginibacter mallensis TaxID=652787 RepID=A0A1H2BJW5_MUCMA|nr:DUF4255 domain-containing protein [Mucilaginibacter mallensis]SDT58332.1 Protein of unknown function [Mucilaginibacter mallensis]